MLPPPPERIETARVLLKLNAAVLQQPLNTLPPPPLERVETARGLTELYAAGLQPPPSVLLCRRR